MCFGVSAAPAGREISEVSELPDASRPHNQITAAPAQEEEAAQHQRSVQREDLTRLTLTQLCFDSECRIWSTRTEIQSCVCDAGVSEQADGDAGTVGAVFCEMHPVECGKGTFCVLFLLLRH